MCTAWASIGLAKRSRIVRAAQHYLMGWRHLPPVRFDVVLIEATVKIAALAASTFRPRPIPEPLQSELKKKLVESP